MSIKRILLVCLTLMFQIRLSQGASYILTYCNSRDVSASTVDEMKLEISKLGGTITHQYMFFSGFTLDLPNDKYQVLREILDKFEKRVNCDIHIERDAMVHTFGNANHEH